MKRLKESYLHLPMQAKAAFWFTICNFLQRAVSMLTTPVFTRMLPTEQYGRFSTYLSWENVLMMVVSLTLYASMMNLYVKQEDRDRVLSAVTGLELLLTGSWLMAALVFRKPFASITGLSPVLICCIFLYILFYAGIQCWSFHRRYIYGYKILAAVTLLLTVGSSVTGAAAVYFLSATAETRAIAATAVTAGIGLVIYLSIFKKSLVFYDGKMWRFAFTFSLALLPHHLSAFILQSSDKIMINYMCGSKDVAIYSVAYSVGSVITMVSSAVNQSFVPYQFQKLEAGEYEKLGKRANQVLAFVGIMLCLVMLMSKEIVMIFGGAKYLNSAAIIIPICLGVYFNYMFQMFARAQQYFEKKGTIVLPSVLCAGLNLLLNFIFIRKYGYQAAAYTTFICYFVFCLIHFLFYKRLCKEELKGQQIYDAKGLAGISAAVMAAGAAIWWVNQFPVVKYGLLAALLLFVIIRRKRVFSYVKTLWKR